MTAAHVKLKCWCAVGGGGQIGWQPLSRFAEPKKQSGGGNRMGRKKNGRAAADKSLFSPSRVIMAIANHKQQLPHLLIECRMDCLDCLMVLLRSVLFDRGSKVPQTDENWPALSDCLGLRQAESRAVSRQDRSKTRVFECLVQKHKL